MSITTDPLDLFAGISPPGSMTDNQPDTYPGSSRKRRAVAGPVDTWADVPYVELTMRGIVKRFYYISVLADMLGRRPPAIRKWERLGYLPDSGYRTPGRNKNGQRRLYTRGQIEGIVEIAREEGLVGESNRNVGNTAFPARAAVLFKQLKETAA